ncbi:MAG: DUF2141 domain-containing protein [Cyclobacteriaceae bacterium]|nr:DUF2141 domain-containing protein [Cyclobacteriaceae bacterium]
MEKIKEITLLLITGVILTSFIYQNEEKTYSLTVSVSGLLNSNGVVQFSLYNKDGSIPDEHYRNYYKQLKSKIISNTSNTTFQNLPPGIYAVNILHDENEDGKIDKGFILPAEGIGFSNLESINPLNRPNFKKTKFELNTNKTILVKMIYL